MVRYPICICMAGAVSAGAYSAGAMSVLLKALRRWEDDEIDLPNQPKHRIVIKGMTGASAGSIQAVLSSLDMLSADKSSNLGYDAWLGVTLNDLLDAEDLKQPDAVVKSILNTGALRKVANNAIYNYKWGSEWPSYIDKNYEIRLAVTNLRGVPFNLKLPSSNLTDFGTSRHAEYLRYRFGNDFSGTPATVDHFEINVDSQKMPLLSTLIDGALASSAFPFAFEPVKIKRPTIESNDGQSTKDRHDVKEWLSPISVDRSDKQTVISFESIIQRPDWNPSYGEQHFIYAVDGGVLNNEPILEAFKLLTESGNADWQNFPDTDLYDKDKERFSGGRVILIDPFPNSLDKDIDDDKLRIDKQAGALKSALIRNARFSEPIVLAKKLRERVGLVYPSNPLRQSDADKSLPEVERKLPIKSGSMSGFAGFLKTDFLEHDFELGRINMERFLRYHFTVPENHPLVAKDKGYLDKWKIKDENGEFRVPIIPVYSSSNDGQYLIFESENEENEKLAYYRSRLSKFDEKFTESDRSDLEKQLDARLQEVGKRLAFNHKPSKAKRYENEKIKKSGSWISNTRPSKWVVGKITEKVTNRIGSYLSNAVLETIENSLAKQDLLSYKVFDSEGDEIKYKGGTK